MRTLLLIKHDTVELAVHRMVLVERTRVLRKHVEFTPECRKCAAVNRVRVCCAQHVRTRGVDGRVDHEGGGVE